MEEPKAPLHAPRKQRRRGISPVRCCIGILIFLAVLASIAIGATIFYAGRTVWRALRDPHKAVFDPDMPSFGMGTVRPLIGDTDTFDLVLGVWVREPLPRHEHVDNSELELGTWSIVNQSSDIFDRKQISLNEDLYARHDRIIYEDTIFRNVRTDSKDLDTTVQFNLPTDILKERLLISTDIRITLTVIPHSTDIDNVQSYSDWRPVNADPFSRLSPGYSTKHASDNPLKWEVLEHVALSYHPLVFHDDNECLEKSQKVDWKLSPGHDNWAFPPHSILSQMSVQKALTAKPYLYTRAHIYMIKETRDINAGVFEHNHQELRRKSCGEDHRPPNPSRWFCHRDYESHGNWETKIDLGERDDERDLRYGPYLDILRKAAGPKHVVRLPGTRPICRNVSSPIEQLPETIPIEYHIRFSTMSPARVKVLDDMMFTGETNFTATDRETRLAHDTWELTSGLFGNAVHGTRPYTRFLLAAVGEFALPIANVILSFLYWATRQTTAGISIASVWCLTLSLSIDAGHLVVEGYKTEDYSLIAFQSVFVCWILAQIWFLVRLVTPYDLSWNGKTVSLERKDWTRRERASKRINTGPWLQWLGIVILLWLVQYFSALDRFHLIPSVLPPDPPTKRLEVATASLVDALYATSIGLQLVHNHQSQTFAGTYNLVARISLAETILRLMYHVPAVVGRYEVGRGLGIDMVIRLVLEVTRVWQGYKWSRVEQVVQEDED